LNTEFKEERRKFLASLIEEFDEKKTISEFQKNKIMSSAYCRMLVPGCNREEISLKYIKEKRDENGSLKDTLTYNARLRQLVLPDKLNKTFS